MNTNLAPPIWLHACKFACMSGCLSLLQIMFFPYSYWFFLFSYSKWSCSICCCCCYWPSWSSSLKAMQSIWGMRSYCFFSHLIAFICEAIININIIVNSLKRWAPKNHHVNEFLSLAHRNIALPFAHPQATKPPALVTKNFLYIITITCRIEYKRIISSIITVHKKSSLKLLYFISVLLLLFFFLVPGHTSRIVF